MVILTRIMFLLTKRHVLISTNREFFKTYLNKKKGRAEKGENGNNIYIEYYVQARKLYQQTDVPLLC